MNTIGENIAMLRKQKGMTQETLASAIGVSAQSISKWENNTNMPDIMLLSIIADVFGVNMDALFGRTAPTVLNNPGQAVEVCRNSLLDGLMTCFNDPDYAESFEEASSRYKKHLDADAELRTGIFRGHGIVYYRKEIGGLVLPKPEGHWHGLLLDEDAQGIIQLLADTDFCSALTEILQVQTGTFTIPSLCRRCKIENIAALEENFRRSGLFSVKKVDIDGVEVSIYELDRGHKLFLLFAICTYAKEFSHYKDSYTGFICEDAFYNA